MADAAFLALTVITIGSAIAALEMRSLIYGSIALMGTLVYCYAGKKRTHFQKN